MWRNDVPSRVCGAQHNSYFRSSSASIFSQALKTGRLTMATAIDDLWPADIATAEQVVAPVTILKQQASLLGQRTKNLVEAVVETEPVDYGRIMRHNFIIVVPPLSFYRYK